MSQINQPEEKDRYWRSIDQLNRTDRFKQFLHREFQEGAAYFENAVSRRTFLKLMGASFAFAGVSGCNGIRKPVINIRPYAKRPEDLVPGVPNFYATAMNQGLDVVGLLVESYEGRPTKIEGNPGHPESLGAADQYHQGSVLNLYDPDRLSAPLKDGKPVSFSDASNALLAALSDSKAGAGVAVVLPSIPSPAVLAQLSELQSRYPKLTIYKYDAFNQDSALDAARRVFGRSVRPDYQFDKADVLLSVGSDFLGLEPGHVKAAKQFSTRRDPEAGEMNRLYVLESSYSITGAKADHRFAVNQYEAEVVLWHIANQLVKSINVPNAGLKSILAKGASQLPVQVDKAVVSAIVADLLSHKGHSLVVAGSSQSQSVHELAFLINELLGNIGKTVKFYDYGWADKTYLAGNSADNLDRLVSGLNAGDVETVIVLGGNPLYDSPNENGLRSAFSKAKNRFVLAESANETTQAATVVFAQSHYLEAWGDLKSIDGTVSVVQPLINPLYEDTRSVLELLLLVNRQSKTAYSYVKDGYRSLDQNEWDLGLQNGVFAHQKSQSVPVKLNVNFLSYDLQAQFARLKSVASDAIYFNIAPSYAVYDGRYSNNGWLLELPDPISKLTWDNAIYISSDVAKRYHLATGDMVSVTRGDNTLEVAVYVLPGQARNQVTLTAGFGREVVGRVGKGTGFNAFVVASLSQDPSPVTIKSLNKTYTLASTQDHWSLEGRPVYRESDVTEYEEHPDHIKHMEHHPPLKALWEDHPYDEGYQWGMVVDLSKCTGCNACVTACQSENNIPIVGKEQILNGREMHWIRLDRYFEGDEGPDARLVVQPVACIQCENAPCEQVCPVNATVHSQEGLNDMVYNRCVGTRYCADNCPLKVRRFNFFDYHQRNPQAVAKDRVHFFDYIKTPDPQIQKQFNPNVTVRMRGVMEKCTYCVQRISAAKIRSKNENREVKDGEIKTACSQTCPSDAIVFGNIRDKESRVSKLKEVNRDYEMLSILNLKPRTSYLGSINNPNPSLVRQKPSTHKAAVAEEKGH